MSRQIESVEEAYREFGKRLFDPWWRLTSGAIYKVIRKANDEDEDEVGSVVPFVPNEEQRRLLLTLHNRKVCLKCRQIGSTTLWCIYGLDHAAFNDHQRVGIVAHLDSAAKAIFRDKVMFAYRNLPEPLRERMPLQRDSAEELLFAHNNSSVRVAVSMRSGTLDRLIVTEYGKLCAQFPERAREVELGSFPAVPKAGVIVVESTAEGRSGGFYNLCQRAGATATRVKAEARRPRPFEWSMAFIGWWQHEEYQLDPAGIAISPKQHEYFDDVEHKMGCKISLRQRAWYVDYRDNQMSGDVDERQEKMWQEYPSTPEEAFAQSTEQYFFGKAMLRARAAKRITTIPFVSHVPVNTFWDIGHRDGTGIWVHQHIHPNHRFLRYIEGWGEPYDTFVRQLDAMDVVWGRHYLPHDAMQERQGEYKAWTPLSVLQGMKPNWRWEIVPRVDEKIHAISAVRTVFPECWFDEAGCKEGLEHLELYSKKWVPMTASWSDEPLKDEHTEAADAFMQFAQAYEALNVNPKNVPTRKGARKRIA